MDLLCFLSLSIFFFFGGFLTGDCDNVSNSEADDELPEEDDEDLANTDSLDTLDDSNLSSSSLGEGGREVVSIIFCLSFPKEVSYSWIVLASANFTK